ncbi:Exosome complex component RRP42 [Daphnia magna]|uniref:Ribosomal RNA-processing protein 42 n=1 Tax=Daphnia magna TaxID=35525 RepID=A0A162P571_9CRUS|nr:Exosome complex component RRP42 [Daphnia magna]SVE83300.1 EOG090X0CWA [Daphnia magna]
MAEILLSEAEKAFIHHGVQDDLRCDGRTRLDYRPIILETGLVSNASGSSRLRLANSDVLVGVKVELASPLSEKPLEGRLEFFVDCSANATPKFEGRGGEDLANEICRFLQMSYMSGDTINLAELSVLTGQQCWVLYVDILILECGGNLYDTVSLAVKSALYTTQIPSIKVATMDGDQPELELSEDPYDTKRLNTQNVPCLVTLMKIGNHYLVDPTPEEECCSSSGVVVAVSGTKKITAVRKIGSGSLHPESLVSMLKTASEVGTVVNKILMNKLLEEERAGKTQKVGFMR